MEIRNKIKILAAHSDVCVILFGRGSLSILTVIVAYASAHGIYNGHFMGK